MHNLIPVIVVLFIVASLLRIDYFFSVVYILAGVYILGRIWSNQAIRQLRAERKLVNRAFPGEVIPITLRVHNTGWLPVQWVEIHDSLPVTMATPPFYRQAIALKGHEERRFEYSLKATVRGYYNIGPLIWRTGGICWAYLPQIDAQQQSEYVIIYPQVLPLDQLGLPTRSPLAQLAAPQPLFEDPSRITGLRDYRIGDSPAACTGAPALVQVNIGQALPPAIARETVICLDMDQHNYNMRHFVAAIELAITTTASLANHIVSNDHLAAGLNMQYFDPLEDAPHAIQLPSRNDRAQLMNMLEILARAQRYDTKALQPDALLPFTDFVRAASTNLSGSDTRSHNWQLQRQSPRGITATPAARLCCSLNRGHAPRPGDRRHHQRT